GAGITGVAFRALRPSGTLRAGCPGRALSAGWACGARGARGAGGAGGARGARAPLWPRGAGITRVALETLRALRPGCAGRTDRALRPGGPGRARCTRCASVTRIALGGLEAPRVL